MQHTQQVVRGCSKHGDSKKSLNEIFNTNNIGSKPSISKKKTIRRTKKGRPGKNEIVVNDEIDPSIMTVHTYKIKIDEFFNIVYDYLTGFDLDYILNKYRHRPSTLLVVNYRNWLHVFQQEFGNELSNYLLNNKSKFRSLTMGVYETKYLHCKIRDVADRYILNEYQFECCLNNKTHKICHAIADGFWNFRLNNT